MGLKENDLSYDIFAIDWKIDVKFLLLFFSLSVKLLKRL